MTRLQVRRYKKRYLTKAVYQCKSYFLYVPRPIAEEFIDVELTVRKVGPIIIATPVHIHLTEDVLRNLAETTNPKAPIKGSPEEELMLSNP